MAGLLRMSSIRTTLFAPSAPTSRSYSTCAPWWRSSRLLRRPLLPHSTTTYNPTETAETRPCDGPTSHTPATRCSRAASADTGYCLYRQEPALDVLKANDACSAQRHASVAPPSAVPKRATRRSKSIDCNGAWKWKRVRPPMSNRRASSMSSCASSTLQRKSVFI